MAMAIAEPAWDEAVRLLAGAPEVALACHVDPDGDALGSMLALAGFLAGRGVAVTASFGDSPGGGAPWSVPAQYHFLPGLEHLVDPARFPSAPSVVVTLDAGSPDRLGGLAEVLDRAGCVLVMDHHATGDDFGDVRLVDGDAAATAVLVEELIRRMGGELDADIATCLYTGLVTDTGRFQHPNTTPAVLELAARLVATGIDHAEIARRIWETERFSYLKLLARVLERAELAPATGLAWTAIRQRDLHELDVALAETEGIIDVLRAVDSADCAMVCKEQSDGQWKVSLRSRGATDVGAVAGALGGGGHLHAAGFTACGSLEQVVERVATVLASQDFASSSSGVDA